MLRRLIITHIIDINTLEYHINWHLNLLELLGSGQYTFRTVQSTLIQHYDHSYDEDGDEESLHIAGYDYYDSIANLKDVHDDNDGNHVDDSDNNYDNDYDDEVYCDFGNLDNAVFHRGRVAYDRSDDERIDFIGSYNASGFLIDIDVDDIGNGKIKDINDNCYHNSKNDDDRFDHLNVIDIYIMIVLTILKFMTSIMKLEMLLKGTTIVIVFNLLIEELIY